MDERFFSRMSLIIINKCNQRCPYCFEGEWKDGHTQMMSLDDIRRLLEWKNWDDGKIPTVFLLGGEPTLHPKLLDILDIITNYDQRIVKSVLTNLNCDVYLLKELIAKQVILFANIDQFDEGNNVSGQQTILRNLDFLNNVPITGFYYNVSATVTHPDKDFSFLYDIIKKGKDKIYNLRLASSCPGYRFGNEFQKDFSDDYMNKVYEVVRKCKEINPHLHLSSECPINGCMVSDELYQKLNEIGYQLRFQCGLPEPNADICPDMHVHWCFAFEGIEDMTIRNVFDYPDYNSMIKALMNLARQFNEKYKPICDMGKCTRSMCYGPCPALNYYFRVIKR
ncbi:MAG: radical SAM protein [Caulobacteraceae bacterium]